MPRRHLEQPNRSVAQPTGTASIAPAWHDIPTAAARRFHQVCLAKSSKVLGAFGLTSLQFRVMIHLNRKTGSPGIEQNTLAARLNIDRNTASVVVEQMVKLGVVARQVNGADRRARLLSLTAKGDRIYGELLPAHAVANASVLAPISPRERKLFMNLLIRVVEGNLRQQKSIEHGPRRSNRKPPVNKT
jgi:MarR family transcriptional regulator, lower aerobic nicotinate degradation pathway regulator